MGLQKSRFTGRCRYLAKVLEPVDIGLYHKAKLFLKKYLNFRKDGSLHSWKHSLGGYAMVNVRKTHSLKIFE